MHVGTRPPSPPLTGGTWADFTHELTELKDSELPVPDSIVQHPRRFAT